MDPDDSPFFVDATLEAKEKAEAELSELLAVLTDAVKTTCCGNKRLNDWPFDESYEPTDVTFSPTDDSMVRVSSVHVGRYEVETEYGEVPKEVLSMTREQADAYWMERRQARLNEDRQRRLQWRQANPSATEIREKKTLARLIKKWGVPPTE